MPVSLTDLPPGFDFAPASFTITPEAARGYRRATGDKQDDVYAAAGNAVPPLAVAALALGELLKQVSLPEGSLHASEALEFDAFVPEGAAVVCVARLAQRSVRAGYVWSVLQTDLTVDGTPVISARATVLSPIETGP